MDEKRESPARRRLVRLLIIFSILLLAAVLGILILQWNYAHSEKSFEQMRAAFVSTEESSESLGETEEGTRDKNNKNRNLFSSQIKIDFDQLKKINPDIIGWIHQKDSPINYPILYSGDNDTYLRRIPDGSVAVSGSIFLEEKNSPGLEDAHIMIYGHNMRNGTMFGSLKAYRQGNYLKTHPFFQLYSPEGMRNYRVFGWQVIPGDSFVYTVFRGGGEEYDSFIRRLLKNCDYYTGEKLTDRDQIVTLSTCTSLGDRFVVHGVRVDGADDE